MFIVGGCAISWKVTLQCTRTLSIIEVEYMAVTKAYNEALWLKGLFGERSEQLQISTLFYDNQSAIFHLRLDVS